VQPVEEKRLGYKFHLITAGAVVDFRPLKFRHSLLLDKLRLSLEDFLNNREDSGNFAMEILGQSASVKTTTAMFIDCDAFRL
jgi:hypothetical protein